MTSSATALAIPENTDVVRALPSEALYKLEVAGQIATEVLDERVVQWTEEGWSQRKIAEEMGCSQPAISKRQARLGIESSNDWREVSAGGGDNRVITPDDEEDYEGGLVPRPEVIEPTEVLPPTPPTRYLPDEYEDGAEENLRTVSLRWFQQGRDIQRLLEEGAEVEAKSREDKEAIKQQTVLMVKIARTLKGAL